MIQFAAAQAITVGQTSILMQLPNDGSVLPGMECFDSSTLTTLGSVFTYTNKILTLKAPIAVASASAADVLLFAFTPSAITPPDQLQLNPVQTDYPGIFNQLLNELIQEDVWNDLANTSTGTTLLRFMASIGAFAQGAAARALQENFLDTARSPSGVLRATRLQGTHVIRATSGTVQVQATRTDSVAAPLVVPQLQQWSVGGQDFYNAAAATFSTTGASLSLMLSRGTVETSTLTASGLPYQRYVLSSPGAWNLADTIPVATDSTGQVWTGIRTGLWRQASGDAVFWESTLPDGTIQCVFGDGTYGAIPPAGTITFAYVQVAPAASTVTAPPVGSAGAAVSSTVTIVVSTSASPNVDPPSPEFYKAMGPGGPAIASGGATSTRPDYRARALQYPGVLDAHFQGQAELNPADRRYMNVMAVTLLTSAPWNQTQWLVFKQYLETIGIATEQMFRLDPTPVPISISMDIACLSSASLGAITSMAQSAIAKYFAFTNQSLGWSFEPSDLELAIAAQATYLQAPGESGALIDYLDVSLPIQPVSLPLTKYFVLTGTPALNVFYSQRGVNSASSGRIVGI